MIRNLSVILSKFSLLFSKFKLIRSQSSFSSVYTSLSKNRISFVYFLNLYTVEFILCKFVSCATLLLINLHR